MGQETNSPIAVTTSLGRVSEQWPRQDILLDSGWRSACNASPSFNDPIKQEGFEKSGFDDSRWKEVRVPHNWQDYSEIALDPHGSLHGTAWYRKEFTLPTGEKDRRVFFYFEGVGSYAKVWVNGRFVGKHSGGRTTFTLDITDAVHPGAGNLLAVEAAHPKKIDDLPWVEGGAFPINGFSEGSQPFGNFRAVHLITTGPSRIEPFGVHIWNDATASENSATLHIATEIRNYLAQAERIVLESKLVDHDGHVVATLSAETNLPSSGMVTLRQQTQPLEHVRLWSPSDPYLYSLQSTVMVNGLALDRVDTPVGIRVIKWPSSPGPFLINGKIFFINGISEYEHVLGVSHAFTDEQIRARIRQVESAGFNAFRDAHQPHNLCYQDYLDRDGLLWWPQFVSHIWFDNPAFRENFKTLLREWVIERRNSPALVLWGLSNESILPEDFAKECTAIIRELDPTCPSQRLVTTCNGGKGTDWNVPQNWSGTYGGHLDHYGEELAKTRLVGEYGAWRNSGTHSEGGFLENGPLTEDRAAALLEKKVALAESVRDQVCGHFQWLFASHENPGRKIGPHIQAETDKETGNIGPINNKGLFTLWGEPTDAFYMYRANYAPAKTDPMAVIVSHTWPDRWTGPGVKSNITVYSNCDEVELFNDYKMIPLGTRTRGMKGTHFQWDNVNVEYNLLYAEGRIGGKMVASDVVVLKNLPEAPHLQAIMGAEGDITSPIDGGNYLYRVHCGGPGYTDVHGNRWTEDHDFTSDDPWGALSWAADYGGLPPRLASQGEITDPIIGTRDGTLFQFFRFGREKLRYYFALPNGDYTVELFFTEPWYGRGGGDCTGWRLFDVAANGKTFLHDLDLWKECGYCHPLKKTFPVKVTDGWLEISFPRVASYQAVISAIAISSADQEAKLTAPLPLPSRLLPLPTPKTPHVEQATSKDGAGVVYLATVARLTNVRSGNYEVDFGSASGSLSWTIQAGLGGLHPVLITYQNSGTEPISAEIKVISQDGTVVDSKRWSLPVTQRQDWSVSGPENGLGFNAGSYTVTLSTMHAQGLKVKSLTLQ